MIIAPIIDVVLLCLSGGGFDDYMALIGDTIASTDALSDLLLCYRLKGDD